MQEQDNKKETRAKLDKISELFGNKGWEELLSELKSNKESILNGAIYLNKIEEIYFHRGRLSVYEDFLNLDKVVEQGYKNLESDEVDDISGLPEDYV